MSFCEKMLTDRVLVIDFTKDLDCHQGTQVVIDLHRDHYRKVIKLLRKVKINKLFDQTSLRNRRKKLEGKAR